MTVRVQTEDFDIGAEIMALRKGRPDVGAVVHRQEHTLRDRECSRVAPDLLQLGAEERDVPRKARRAAPEGRTAAPRRRRPRSG